MGTNYTIADWIAGTAILLATLIVPFAIRRWIVRRPLSKTTAGLTAFGIWLGLFSFFWWAASLADLLEAYSRKPHLGILAIAVISYWMLTSTGKDTPQQADYESSSGDSSLGTESRRTPQFDPKRAAAAMRKHRATAPPETVVSKQMNWKRGLLRLWLILSLLWLAGAGSIAVLESSPRLPDFSQYGTPVTDAPEPRFGNKDTLVSEPPTIRYGENDTLVECSGLNSNSAEAFLDCFDADSSEPRPTDGREPRFGSADKLVTPEVKPRYDTSGLKPYEPTTRVEYVRDWNLPERDVMSLIIGVPLLALGLGMAIAWISSGFRDPNKDTT